MKNGSVQVSQPRLAEIQQLQSEIAALHIRLSKEWNKLRKELKKGTPVEHGPIRAFFKKKGRQLRLYIK